MRGLGGGGLGTGKTMLWWVAWLLAVFRVQQPAPAIAAALFRATVHRRAPSGPEANTHRTPPCGGGPPPPPRRKKSSNIVTANRRRATAPPPLRHHVGSRGPRDARRDPALPFGPLFRRGGAGRLPDTFCPDRSPKRHLGPANPQQHAPLMVPVSGLYLPSARRARLLPPLAVARL